MHDEPMTIGLFLRNSCWFQNECSLVEQRTLWCRGMDAIWKPHTLAHRPE